METESETGSMIQQTEHPYIVHNAGICGGRAIIKGTRISVQHIAELYKAGDTIEEILQSHPHIQAAAVFDALSYYLDHQAEIEQEIADNRRGSVMKKYRLAMDEHGGLHYTGKTPTV
jgi:uncharacterized protein (DUF433 family)